MKIDLNNKATLNSTLLAGVAAAALLLPAQAFAQDGAPESASQSRGTDSIIVTATRREERAQDVPITITALSSEGIRERGIQSLQDMQASVPSLVVAQNGQSTRDVMSPSIRGQSASFQGAPAVVVYMNEVPLPTGYSRSSQGGAGNYVDLQNVQVLSGVQGTLFGRNTTGGAVLLTPAKPTADLEGYMQGAYGNYNMTEFEAMINIPISDTIRLRIVGQSRDRDGFTYDVNWNKDRDDLHTRMARVGLWLQPNDTVTNYTMGYYGYSKNNGTGAVPERINERLYTTPGPGGSPSLGALTGVCAGGTDCSYLNGLIADQQARGVRSVAHGVDDSYKNVTWGINNTTDIFLSDELTLRNIISYSHLNTFFGQEAGGLLAPIYDTGKTVLSRLSPRDSFQLFTEELQLQGSAADDKITYTIGGFYFSQTPDDKMISYSTTLCGNQTVAGCRTSLLTTATSNKSKALYAQGTLDFGVLSPALDNLRLTAGYRYTWDTVSGTTTGYSYSDGPGGTEVAQLCSTVFIFTTDPYADCTFSGSRKDSAGTWTIGLDYRPTPDVMLYAKASKGYKGGGFNSYAVFPDTITFGPENVMDYEAGFKTNFDIGDVQTMFNVNGFYLDYTNIQRAAGDRNPVTRGNGAVTLSSASAVIKGIEVQAMIKPVRELEIGVNYSHLSSHYKSFIFDSNSGVYDCTATGITSPKVFAGADMSCRPLQYLAPNIVSVYGRLEVPIPERLGEVSLFATYNWTDAQETAPFSGETFPDGTLNEPGVRLASFGVLNASLDWRNALESGLDVSLFGSNLTNEVYRTSNTGVYQTIGVQTSIYGEPRMYGLRLRYSFGGN